MQKLPWLVPGSSFLMVTQISLQLYADPPAPPNCCVVVRYEQHKLFLGRNTSRAGASGGR